MPSRKIGTVTMAEFEVIPQAAIDKLVANPTVAPAFNSVFGAGRAEEVLAAQSPAPAPEVEPEDDEWSFSGEAFRAVAGGVRDAVQETGNFVDYVSDNIADVLVGEGNEVYFRDGRFQILPRAEAGDQPILGDGGTIDLPKVEKNKTVVGNLGRGVVQFAAGYVTAGNLTRMKGLKGAFVNGAVADAVVMDPDNKNVTAMLAHYGYDMDIVTDLLATDPDDPEWMNRARNAAEGVAIGGIVEAIGWGIRAKKALASGDTQAAKKATEAQQAALKELDAAVKEAGEEVAKDAQRSLDLSKTVFDEKALVPAKTDAEGQISLDLGDTPLPIVKPDAQPVPNRLFITPEKAENLRLQASLAQGVETPAKMSSTSFKSLTTVSSYDEVADDIAANVAVFADEFAKVKGGDVQRWATVKAQSAAKLRQMADMTGEQPEALIARFRSANDGDMAKLAAEIHAQSRYVLTIEQELQKMAKAIVDHNSGKGTDLSKFAGINDIDHLKLAFNQRREVATNLLSGLDASRSNIARAMNAMKIAKEGDERLREILKDPEAFRDVDAAARAVVDPANNGKPAIRVIDETLQGLRGFVDGVNTYRINALLSGPGTQEVNFISNVVNSIVIPTEQMLGGLASADRQIMIHALRQFQGQFLGSLDSVQTALKTLWDNNPRLDAGNTKLEEVDFSQATSLIGKTVRLPSRALMSMDELFKQSQYRGVVFADALAEAARQGLKGAEKTEAIKRYIRESYTDTGAATRGDALLQSRRATFTETLEPGVASIIQKAAIDQPVIRFFIPFVRTPVNLLSQTFQHMPVVGTVSKRFRADIAAGGARAAQAKGRQVLGSALVGIAGYMAANGMIVGSGPKDPRIRRVWLKNNQPYSFRIVKEDGTVEFISYARLEPLSNVFSIAADAVEIMNDEYNERDETSMINALRVAVMENTVNKTFTQGIYDAMQLFVGRPHEQERAAKNFVASFVPNVLNQTNGDEALREVRSYSDAILARTGLYNGIDPKRNILGEVITRRLPKYDPLGLTQADRREIDTVLEEITRMAIANQAVAGEPSRRVSGPNRIDLSQVQYSDTQSVYDRWLELTGTVKINGRTLRQELEKLFNSRRYKIAPEGELGAISGTKGALIRKVIVSYRKAAQGEFKQLQEIVRAEKQGQGELLKAQVQRNRELFPVKAGGGTVRVKRRTFEDLLKE